MSAIPLHLAALDTVNRLLAGGADVNARADANETPLRFAATVTRGKVATFDSLLDRDTYV